MESVFYLLVYLLNHNYLPWNDFETKYKVQEIAFKELLHQRMHIQYTKRLFNMIPSKLKLKLTFIRGTGRATEEDLDSFI